MPSSSISSIVPPERIRVAGDVPASPDGKFVLYWMRAFRRATWNFSLDRAVAWASSVGRPLLVLESLAVGRRWDTERHHRFVLEGMAENARRLNRQGVLYYPFVEAAPGETREAVVALAKDASVVVADDFPMREHVEDADEVARHVRCRMEQIDSNGLLPLRVASETHSTAHAFRRFLQRNLREHLLTAPHANPFSRARLPNAPTLPRQFIERWPKAPANLLAGDSAAMNRLPVDHSVASAVTVGGSREAEQTWKRFLAKKLSRYVECRNHPDRDASSGLSPYLHHGHISVHQIFAELAKVENWAPSRLADRAHGAREGWWGMSEAAEAFLDELVTWREVGFNAAAFSSDYDHYESLPDWARKTLASHRRDRRSRVYSLDEFEQAQTHDPLWNAAQTQLAREGRLHNYLRMLWGKKILEWTADPREALEVMIELNNKYALDGRDPNSYSGILWVLGRYDRAWGPERPVFGTVRYMSSENTARKVRVKDYLRKYARG